MEATILKIERCQVCDQGRSQEVGIIDVAKGRTLKRFFQNEVAQAQKSLTGCEEWLVHPTRQRGTIRTLKSYNSYSCIMPIHYLYVEI